MKTLGLYIHIPFCRKKCNYCDFYSLPTDSSKKISSYVSALCSHITRESALYRDYTVDTVFFGGGTPSLLSNDDFSEIFKALRESFRLAADAEISIEANPGTLDFDKLKLLRSLGVNRLSIGLQSSSDSELLLLGRIHTLKDFEICFDTARSLGFDNISVDVMYALPKQSKSDFIKTLNYVIKKAPEHISSYCLKIEDGTPFSRLLLDSDLPSEDVQYEMYLDMCELLEKNGYKQYEISNFAKSGKRCRHNMKYWLSEEYVSFGPGAHSFFDFKRYSYEKNLHSYTDAISKGESPKKLIEDQAEMSQKDREDEYVMLRMRLCDGASASEFYSLFGKSIVNSYPEIERFIKTGHIEFKDGTYRFTKEGFFVSSYILSSILFE